MYFRAIGDHKDFSGRMDKYFKKARAENNSNVCLIPQFLEKAGYPVKEWDVDFGCLELMLDFRSNDFIEAMKKNQHGKTFGLSAW